MLKSFCSVRIIAAWFWMCLVIIMGIFGFRLEEQVKLKLARRKTE